MALKQTIMEDNEFKPMSGTDNERTSPSEGQSRPQRQRIPYGERVSSSRGYKRQGDYQHSPSNYQRDNDGYRPSYQRQERSFRRPNRDYGYRSGEGQYVNPRYSSYQSSPENEGGYQPQYSQQEGGYQPRPRYGTQRPHYENRGGYGEGRGNYGDNRGNYGEGRGYQSRGGYQKPGFRKGGYNKPNRPYRQRTADYDPSAKYNVQKVLRFKEANIDPDAPIRLNRYLANAGVCSRREADTHIAAGLVTVNGEVITELGHKVLRTDQVEFKGSPVTLEDKIYILLNKPKDYVTTADDPEGRKTVMDLVKGACPERIYPVGRLDRNTTGVLLLTNDGEMAAKMMHPQFMKKKIYHVYCNKSVSFADMQKILAGIMLEDGEIKADRVEYANETDRKQIGIEIHSGKNRIVRRIFESLGYKVVKLDRVYFAGLTKKNLRRGHWRFLEEAEVNMLRMGAYE